MLNTKLSSMFKLRLSMKRAGHFSRADNSVLCRPLDQGSNNQGICRLFQLVLSIPCEVSPFPYLSIYISGCFSTEFYTKYSFAHNEGYHQR